jgi:hypothetical protein
MEAGGGADGEELADGEQAEARRYTLTQDT